MSKYIVEIVGKSGLLYYPKKLDVVCNEIAADFTTNIEEAVIWGDKLAAEIFSEEYENAKVIEVVE